MKFQFVRVSFGAFGHTRERRRVGRRGQCVFRPTNCLIDAKPAVTIQSGSASPGIAIAPRAVGQVPIPGDGSTGSAAQVHNEAAPMESADVEVRGAEENELWEDDVEEEEDEINHAKLPSEAIHAHSPGRRVHTSSVWKHLSRIGKHDVPGHAMTADMTHVCRGLGALNDESFCERVLSCVKLVVSDLHVRLKAEEIRMLVMLRMNREFMEYMRVTYPDTPLSEFKVADTYVRTRGGLETLVDDEDDD